MAVEHLTDREHQIAILVAQGLPDKRIAHQLRISYATVRTHLSRIFTKLEVDNRLAVAAAMWGSKPPRTR